MFKRKPIITISVMGLAAFALLAAILVQKQVAEARVVDGIPFGLPNVLSVETSTSGNSETVKLTWDFPLHQNYIEQYQVHRREAGGHVTSTAQGHVQPGPWVSLATIAESQRLTAHAKETYSDDGVASYMTYDYRVAALYANEEQWFYSNVATVSIGRHKNPDSIPSKSADLAGQSGAIMLYYPGACPQKPTSLGPWKFIDES